MNLQDWWRSGPVIFVRFQKATHCVLKFGIAENCAPNSPSANKQIKLYKTKMLESKDMNNILIADVWSV